MKKQVFLCGLFIFLIITFLYNCKKSTNIEEVNENVSDTLSYAEAKQLDSLPVDSLIEFSNFKFPDGSNMEAFAKKYDSANYFSQPPGPKISLNLSIDQERKVFITRMLHWGTYLRDIQHIKPDKDGPGQFKLAYVSGSKTYIKRQTPSKGICTKEKLFGLDCSGLIYQMANLSKLSFNFLRDKDCAHFQDTANWNKALNGFQEFKGLQMVDLGYNVPDTQIMAGDILIWYRGEAAMHIGMACTNRTTGKLEIINSSGSPSTCPENKDIFHGPVIRDFTILPANSVYKKNFKVLRIIAPISVDGDWLVTLDIELCDVGTLTKIVKVTGGNFSDTLGTCPLQHGGYETVYIKGTLTLGFDLITCDGVDSYWGSACQGVDGFQDFINTTQYPPMEGDIGIDLGLMHWKKID